CVLRAARQNRAHQQLKRRLPLELVARVGVRFSQPRGQFFCDFGRAQRLRRLAGSGVVGGPMASKKSAASSGQLSMLDFAATLKPPPPPPANEARSGPAAKVKSLREQLAY